MKLQVSVLEAKGLEAADSNGLSDPFVKLILGSSKALTSVKYKELNPNWSEDFIFVIEDADEELNVEVWDKDRFADDFLGQVKVPVSSVLNANKHTLNRIWYPLQKRSASSETPVSGKICLSLSVFGRDVSERKPALISTTEIPPVIEDNLGLISSIERRNGEGERTLSRTSSTGTDSSVEYTSFLDKPASPRATPYADSISESNTDDDQVGGLGDNRKGRSSRKNRKWKDAQRVASRLSALFKKPGKHSRDNSPSFSEPLSRAEMSVNSSIYPLENEANIDDEEKYALSFFDDDNDDSNLRASLEEIPPPLSGGVLVDQNYGVSTKKLNAIIFKSGSTFVQDLIIAQKSTEYIEEPWTKGTNGLITRVTSYIKAASKLVKALKTTEIQTFTRADRKCFCILATVATPDAPYGGNFLVEVQTCISARPELPGGTKSCHLLVSYRINFLHNTMMKGMIESGCRTGIRETYAIYIEVLGKHAQQDSVGNSLRDPLTKSFSDEEERPVSPWEEAWDYFGKWNVLLALLSLMIILVHIALSPPKKKAGLDFWRVQFPDSYSELLISAILVIQVERVVIMVYDYVRARYWQVGDHGMKAQGDGWFTTITLIEGENIFPTDAGIANPYVVFTCNGKSRTSSVKLRTSQPNWREIFEFDATVDPPSTMDVEVFDYDGPFSEPETLGHAEINFLRQSPADLSDFWIPLDGKVARANGSRIHLRIFLSNTRDSDTLPDYLERVEREVGLKVSRRSSQRNESFQKLFSVPAEEFLYNDFACAVKRRILIQGRLFLSVRLLGFYSNLFGHKTKFALLWEDIEEIKELSQSLNPSIMVFLRKGRGFDARHGARGIDGKGRLKFTFLSFLRSGTAFKTIVALWKNRNLSPEQRMDIVASVVDGDMRYAISERQSDDSHPFHRFEESGMSEILSIEIPITAQSILSALNNNKVDQSISEKLGLTDYKTSLWDHVEETTGAHRRQLTYSLNRQISQFGSQVSCTQQQEVSDDLKKLVIKEILTYHDMPFADHFEVHVKRELETLSLKPVNTQLKAFVGVVWHKSTEAQKKITKNINEHMARQIQELTDITVAEIFQRSGTTDGTKVADEFLIK